MITGKLAKTDFKLYESDGRGGACVWMDNKCPGTKEKGKEDFWE